MVLCWPIGSVGGGMVLACWVSGCWPVVRRLRIRGAPAVGNLCSGTSWCSGISALELRVQHWDFRGRLRGGGRNMGAASLEPHGRGWLAPWLGAQRVRFGEERARLGFDWGLGSGTHSSSNVALVWGGVGLVFFRVFCQTGSVRFGQNFHDLTSSLPYRRPFTYTKSQSNELFLSPSTNFSVARASSSPFLTHNATAATLTTAPTFSFSSSLLNTEPVEHIPCLSRSFSFAKQIKLKLLFSSSQVSSSTPAPPVVASIPTTAAPLSPFIPTQFWLAYLFSAATIISSSQCFQKESKKEKMLKVKVYADRMFQPSRAVLIFCKVNGIEFNKIKVEISKRQHLSPEFVAINPFKKLPAIVDGRFKLFERMYGVALELNSHQIMLLLLWIVWWQGRMLLQEETLMLLREQHIGKRHCIFMFI
ncbi:hypothetical protein Ahy_B05g079354 [Arachis hypogaea]|uniref:GST N-terminal domain-containing protein n=1 Tax=Arachis hypogaea TaxID=3818 RepID=A0A444Z9M8_ARAHY|nr:hypothetical protein Ahy_B05g079354 [Arachis hypogaea]